MILNGKFILISVESRTGKDGKVYKNANIEAEDGKVLNIGVDTECAKMLTSKYQKHEGFFDIGTYNGQMYMRLKEAYVVK